MIGQDQHTLPRWRQFHLFKPGGGERRPDREVRAGRHDRKTGFDAFAKRNPPIFANRREAHGPACDASHHHLRLGHIRLAHLVRVLNKVSTVQPDHVTATIAHLPKKCCKAGLGFPMGQIVMEQQIAVHRQCQATPLQILGNGRLLDRHRVGQNMGDILRCVTFWRWFGQGRLACWRPRENASRVCCLDDQGTPGQTRGRFNGTDRPATLIAVKVNPVSGMLPAQGDDAGAGVARRITANIRQPPFIADALAVREQPRHPSLGRFTQTQYDQVQIIAICLRPRRHCVVEINHDGSHVCPPFMTGSAGHVRPG